MNHPPLVHFVPSRRILPAGPRGPHSLPVALGAALAALLISGAPCRAQEAAPDTAGYQVTSTSLRYTTENKERVVYLEGGVRIEHETTTITSARGKHYTERHLVVLNDSVRVVDGTAVMESDVGEYYGETNTLVLKGRIRFTDRGWKVECDRARYDRVRRVATLTGHLRLADSTRVMYADTIFYHRDTEIADAVGNVVLLDEVEDYSIAGKHAHYDRVRKEVIVDRSPILTFDLKSNEKGTVKSRTMRFDVDKRIGIASHEVEMLKGETRATCDSAVIYDAEHRAELYGQPKAANGTSSMSGARMLLWYNEKEVERVILPERGILTESPGAGSPWKEESYIEGDSVAIFLSSETVDSVRIAGTSKAMYYPVEGEKNKVSNNYSTGDRMFFRFRDKELSYIRISGKSTGLYRYLNLASRETIDSLAAGLDSSLVFKSFSKANERVNYNADVIEYFADTESIRLHGNAVLKYQNSSLTAERIDFNSKLNLLEATGAPVLEESGQRMYGEDMGYDLDTEAGVIVDGSTKYGEGYYEGRDLFKVGEDILKVYRSTYTTCDFKEPHYSLKSNKMKVYINDKIVSGPIFLYIGDMPIFYLPFMINSLKRARSSGFLRPNFDIGMDSRDGRFIRGLGYYWATNDYTDFLFQTDFNERSNFRIHLGNQYKVRYLLDGGLDGGIRFDFVRNIPNKTNEWTVESDHSQRFSRTMSVRSHLRFVSSDQAQQALDSSEDIRRFIDRRIYSSGNFSKSWGGTRLNLSAERTQTLDVTDSTAVKLSTTLPSFSLNFPRVSLWFGEKHRAGEQGIWERMLGSIMFAPNISATRTTQESIVRKSSTLTANSSAGLAQQRKVGFLDFSPSIGLRWDYYRNLYDRINPAYSGTLAAARPNKSEFSMSLAVDNIGTKLYGTFYPRIGPLVAIRHTINPTVSYSYRPKLSRSQQASQSVSYSLRNSVDLKVKKGGQEVKQSGVLSWNLSGSYDPDLPRDRAFSDISSSVRLGLGSLIAFNLNNTYSPRNKMIVSTGFSTGFDLRGSFTYPAKWTEPTRERITAAIGEEKAAQPKAGEGAPGGGAPQPGSWSFRLNYNFSESRSKDRYGTITRYPNSNIDFSGSVQLSRGWRVNYSGYYDIEGHLLTQQMYSLERDLHCWRASFTHRRFGNEWSYYFQIAVKAHPEIMYERGTRGLQSFFGGGGFPGGGF